MPRLFTLLIAGLALHAGHAQADQKLQAELQAKLAKVIPDAKVTAVNPSPIAGLYEVMLGASVLYMTADGRYTLRGDIFDLQTRANLTDSRRSEARIAALVAEVPRAIEFAPANGKVESTLYVFTDIDCGYCRKLHAEVPKLNAAGIAVQYFAFPRAGLKSESYDKAVAVWCAKDPRSALTAAKQGKKPELMKCDNPVTAQFELGQAVGVQGTPAVFTEDGEEIGGYIPAPELIKMLKENKLVREGG